MCASKKNALPDHGSGGFPPARKLVRSKTTKAFLTADGTWTDDVAQAADVETIASLRTLPPSAKQQFEVYYLFGDQLDPEYDFTAPLF